MFFQKKKVDSNESSDSKTVEDSSQLECDENRLSEFDIEGLDVYAIHYNPETKKTLISYSENNEDFEFDFFCSEKQHNHYVKRLRAKLKEQNDSWTHGDTPNKDGDYLVQLETKLHDTKAVIKTLGRFCKSGYSNSSSKWKLIGFDFNAQSTSIIGSVIAFKNIG